jgi:WD40 repeat protein
MIEAVGYSHLLSTGRDGKVILWDVKKNCKLKEKFLFFWPRAARVSPDERFVALLCNGVELMSIPQLDELTTRSGGRMSRCAAFMPYHTTLVVGRFSGEVLVYEHAGKKTLSVRQSLSSHNQRVEGVAVLPLSSTIITVGSEGKMQFTTKLFLPAGENNL